MGVRFNIGRAKLVDVLYQFRVAVFQPCAGRILLEILIKPLQQVVQLP
jgi:hypothetical protein